MSGIENGSVVGRLQRALASFPKASLRFLRRYHAGLLISIVVCLVSLVLYVPLYLAPFNSPLLNFLRDIELKTLDTRFEIRGKRPPGPEVVILAIDQKSEDVLGRWPFPRSYFAEALNDLRQDGARVAAFDINFPQPDENSALRALKQTERDYHSAQAGRGSNPQFESKLNALLAKADNDKQFAEALSQFNNAILGYFFLPALETGSQDQKRVAEFVNYLSFQAYPRIINAKYAKLFEGPVFTGLSPDLPRFALYAKNFGYFNIFPDADGSVRREPVIAEYDGSFYPSLDVAAAMAYLNVPLDKVQVVFNANGLEYIQLGRVRLPTDPAGAVQIDYRGPPGTFPTYSLADLIEQKLPASDFRNKLVLIGPTATGIGDFAVTPFTSSVQAFPGVEVHANFISDILGGHFIHRGLLENLIDLIVIVLFSLGAGVLLTTVPPIRATATLILLLGVFLWLAYMLFADYRIWIAVFLPGVTLTTNYAAIVSYRFFFEEREKKKVRGAFQQYLPPSLISQIMEHPELLRLGGEEKELTALFSDIRGFTTLSEGLTPKQLVDLLNHYLSEMTAIIFKRWGTLDKYIGDAVMAFWGAPIPQTDHPLRACRAALDMSKALERLRTEWASHGRPAIDIGVGVNTGLMLVGNMGSERRFNFTIMGDNVNLASRLEGLNKQFGTRLIISEATYRRVSTELVARELDLIRVKGKMKPVRIYELVATAEEAGPFRDLINRFQEGLDAYRSGQWEEAGKIFAALHNDYPNDGPSMVFLKRTRDLIAEPPEGAWDGVYVMKTK